MRMLRQHDGSGGQVDARRERLRAHGHGEELLLEEGLDDPPVLGQQAGMVHAHAALQDLPQLGAGPLRPVVGLQGLGQLCLLAAAEHPLSLELLGDRPALLAIEAEHQRRRFPRPLRRPRPSLRPARRATGPGPSGRSAAPCAPRPGPSPRAAGARFAASARKSVGLPTVADNSSVRTCLGSSPRLSSQTIPRSRSEKLWNSSITTALTWLKSKPCSRRFKRISATTTSTGASGFSRRLPVTRPTSLARKPQRTASGLHLAELLLGQGDQRRGVIGGRAGRAGPRTRPPRRSASCPSPSAHRPAPPARPRTRPAGPLPGRGTA